MPARLNGKERTLRAINYEAVDRIPVIGGFIRHPRFLASVAGTDVDGFWADPLGVAIRAFRNLKVDVLIGMILPIRESPVGAQYESQQSNRFTSPEQILAEITTLPSLKELRRTFDFHKHYDDYLQRYTEGQQAIGEDILWLPNTLDHVARFQHEAYFGAENYYMALALYPEAMNRFFEYCGEFAFLRNTAVARAIVDHGLPRLMWIGQDCCDNRGPYIAPETLNLIYLRHVKRSLEPLKDIRVMILWHADGNIMPIVPYLLDAGIDGFQGLQEAIEVKVDVAKLREMQTRSGLPPVIVGSVSSTTTMPFGTPDDVRAEVRRCKTLAAAKRGGWLLNFSSSIGPEVPEENVFAFFEEAAAKA